jgi:leucyl-tRNA synthetase
MSNYDPKKIEQKWQKTWEKDKLYLAQDYSFKKKYYCLDFFPYPSGDGLHVGHFKGYTATDVISRYLRMKGFNVLHPMGWDAFGLPAENYALQTGIHPKISTKKNISRIRNQMKRAGFSYDWTREFSTTDPDYYKWTQWIFLQLFKKGLAYQAEAPINWCPSCKTGLANEEVVDNRCERCGHLVGKKKLRQWFLKITAYADRLLSDLDDLDWPEAIKIMQRNWIGRSEGATIKFPVIRDQRPEKTKAGSWSLETGDYIEVFTTRPDTLFGATFMVLAPEHELVAKITSKEKQKEVQKYVEEALAKSDIQRTEEKDKSGVFTGAYAQNPINNRKIPIWVADYVLWGYGTGAIMAVPAHDARDFEFAKKFKLPIVQVIETRKKLRGVASFPPRRWNSIDTSGLATAYEGEGVLINSGQFNGLDSRIAIQKITQYLEKHRCGKKAISYKLRDWLFSRQRYWGEPIPIVHCPKCGSQAVSEKDLPVLLPEVKSYQPTGTGESPLASIPEFVETYCPRCGGSGKRETNTMPQWAGSCWYYLRFADPKNDKSLISKKKEKYWLVPARRSPDRHRGEGGVDWYVGGAEHAVLHLLYARFWHKFLFDLGVVSTKEPFQKLRNVGIVLGEGGIKMSKSRGNVISPDEIIDRYGADTLRMYELFMGPFDQMIAWDPKSLDGVRRFLGRVWRLTCEIANKRPKEKNDKFIPLVDRLTKKVQEDIEAMHFNTAIAAMMEFINEVSKEKEKLSVPVTKQFILLLTPFAPHIAEDLWQRLGGKYSVTNQPWPKYDPKSLVEKEIVIIVQVNGKLRDKVLVEVGESEAKIKELALNTQRVQKHVAGKKIQNIIVVPNRLVNIVTS